jgi:hypothetical protein
VKEEDREAVKEAVSGKNRSNKAIERRRKKTDTSNRKQQQQDY